MRGSIHSVRRTALVLAAALILSVFCLAACAKKEGEYTKGGDFIAPSGMTEEQSLLFAAVAKVCPRDDNHSKAKYLTFRLEGWSFDKFPEAINEHFARYCESGSAIMMQLNDEELKKAGLLKAGDGDFYKEDELVYADGTGKIFTFSLPEGERASETNCRIKVRWYISDRDSGGFDIELEKRGSNWHYLRTSNAENPHLIGGDTPTGTDSPEK